MSIDEAYLDVTENKLGIKSAVKIARLIQQDIWQELHLPLLPVYLIISFS